MSKDVGKILGIFASIATIIGTCIAAIALIPAFGSWFSPREPIQYSPITTPFDTPNIPSTPTSQADSSIVPETPAQIAVEPITTPIVIDSMNPGVSITVHDSPLSQSNVRIQFLAGNEPLRNSEIWFYYATKDITNKWTLTNTVLVDNTYVVSGKTNSNGIVESTLEPGNYAAYNKDMGTDWNQIYGSWGVKAFYPNSTQLIQTILFPIQAGKTTDIKVSLARLEIGIIDKNGNAVTGEGVEIFCQTKDVANNKIPTECGDGYNRTYTDNTGLVFFNLGSGVYVASLHIHGQDVYFYDISVQPGEIRREILTID
jgi:hypothetical protein